MIWLTQWQSKHIFSREFCVFYCHWDHFWNYLKRQCQSCSIGNFGLCTTMCKSFGRVVVPKSSFGGRRDSARRLSWCWFEGAAFIDGCAGFAASNRFGDWFLDWLSEELWGSCFESINIVRETPGEGVALNNSADVPWEIAVWRNYNYFEIRKQAAAVGKKLFEKNRWYTLRVAAAIFFKWKTEKMGTKREKLFEKIQWERSKPSDCVKVRAQQFWRIVFGHAWVIKELQLCVSFSWSYSTICCSLVLIYSDWWSMSLRFLLVNLMQRHWLANLGLQPHQATVGKEYIISILVHRPKNFTVGLDVFLCVLLQQCWAGSD